MPGKPPHGTKGIGGFFSRPPHRPFDVVIDHERETIRIQGINYSFGLFDLLAFAPKGAQFEIAERAEGVVTLNTLNSLNSIVVADIERRNR